MAYDEVESCRVCGEIMHYRALEQHMLDAHSANGDGPRRCTPVWGSCNLPAGHKGPHNAHAEPEPDNGDGPPKNITIGMETLRRLTRGEAVVIDGVALFAADDFPSALADVAQERARCASICAEEIADIKHAHDPAGGISAIGALQNVKEGILSGDTR